MPSEKERELLLKRLKEDILGPYGEDEILESKPSDVYLTGILWPRQTRYDEEQDESLNTESGSGEEGANDSDEEIAASSMNRQSVAGISFSVLINGENPSIMATVSFAQYRHFKEKQTDEKTGEEKETAKWRRIPYLFENIPISTEKSGSERISLNYNGETSGIYLHRKIVSREKFCLVTITLVNERNPDISSGKKTVNVESAIFQTGIKICPGNNSELVPRPSSGTDRFAGKTDEDASLALLYRNSPEFATGHTCSAEWTADPDDRRKAVQVRTAWIPKTKVVATNPHGHEVFSEILKSSDDSPLSPEYLSRASDKDLKDSLLKIPRLYKRWIELKETEISSVDPDYRRAAEQNLSECLEVMNRMQAGALRISEDPVMTEAFRLANRAIHLQYSWNKERSKKGPFMWRPFQLGFILLCAESVADRKHPDREVMDLLWFPTGGGKTEAYLALIAFIAFYRRLSCDNPDDGAGVAAVMRYTLRLLTTQQFSRAASLILACEAIRRGKTGYNCSDKLGNVPFSIGLWVGGGATPNNYKDAKGYLSGSRTNENQVASPKQLLLCPACGKKLKWSADDEKRKIVVKCQNKNCILNSEESLPVYTVDSDIYDEQPTLLIGTVDKFAQIVRNKEINRLFGINTNNPPDLIVQDELHLISGPLGTVTGLYEVAVDRLFTRDKHPPKIIGSTATIRRADEQIKSLFNRDTCRFPPSGIDVEDSGFAVTDPEAPGRLYAAVTTAGRSGKFTLQAVSASLLQSAGEGINDDKLADPYRTLVTYFNSLRELGGALVLMHDDVNDSLLIIAERRKENKFNPERIEELTSRRTQEEIRDMLEDLTIQAGEEDTVDILLATNMLSVGVDIPRLGLMVVQGQPKGVSEYIQATSRVGRGNVPGLVVSILNNGKVRDRSRYETFVSWHNTLYRDVEATSVTPFASRSRDRALKAVLVALIRNLGTDMLENPDLSSLKTEEKEEIIRYITDRAESIDCSEKDVEKEIRRSIDVWWRMAPEYYLYRREPEKSLLQDADAAATRRAMGINPGCAWPVMNNMRSVETSTPFKLLRGLKNLEELRSDNNGI
ncbi:helicase-related protein [Methanoplanus endosymbiosus]|uniref:Helicase C-terminal domain-containing protein n=1 Tax=Methanoplanus endosymbiosus TaxID=33865 RepID=A0A9E7PQP1_9EURY|nr:helicase-related protein [Methanoplanus endosymbiosus]UUX93191.1 hypothetical protein L6E24_03450 [Methanoplanus endosymbiosus]